MRFDEETYTCQPKSLGSRIRVNGIEFELVHEHWDGVRHTTEYRPVPHRDPWDWRGRPVYDLNYDYSITAPLNIFAKPFVEKPETEHESVISV